MLRHRIVFLTLAALPLGAARAQEGAGGAPSDGGYETTVTALRYPRPLPDAPNAVTVIPREEMRRTPALGTDELVRGVPAALTFRRTPSLVADPSAQGLSLRGVAPSGVSRALVLLDGVPVNDPFGGWIYWRSLPRLGLERIEVAPGGTSSLYGNLALGGVVQLVSRPLTDDAEAEVQGGMLGTLGAAGRAAVTRGPIAAGLEIEAVRSTGYVPVAEEAQGRIDQPAGSRHVAVNGRVEASPGEGLLLAARGSFFDQAQNGGTPLTAAEARVQTGSLSARYDRPELGVFQAVAFGSVERFEQTRARMAPGRGGEELAAEQDVPGRSLGGSVTFASRTLALGGTHVLVAGADLRVVAATTDERLHPPAVMPTSTIGRRLEARQQVAGFFAQESYSPHRVLELTLGLRADRWHTTPEGRQVTRGDGTVEEEALAGVGGTELSPRAALLLRPAERLRVRGGVHGSFRAPTLNELYRPFQVGTVLTAANEALRAERLRGAELGGEVLQPGLGALRVTGFASSLEDPILNVTAGQGAPGGAMRQRLNVGRLRVRGLETSLDVRLGARVTALLGYTLADARIVRATEQPELVGKRPPQDPVHRARGALALVLPARFEGTFQLRAVGAQFEDDLNTQPMGGYVVADLFASVPFRGRATFFGMVQNLLGTRYLVGRAGVDTVGPPFVAIGGVRLR